MHVHVNFGSQSDRSSEAVKLTAPAARVSYGRLGLGLELYFNLSPMHGYERSVGLAATDDRRQLE